MYKLTKAAEKDIYDILKDSLLRFGKVQTDAYFSSLKECMELIDANPQMGVDIEFIRHGYFKFPHKSHVIYYTKKKEYLLFVRILHKSMDADQHV